MCLILSFDENHGVGNSDSGRRDILATIDELTPSGDEVDIDVAAGDICNKATCD